MGREHDDLFAKQSIQLKALTPAQVMECRDVLAELESAGITKTLAAVAVDQGVLTRADAQRLIEAVNKKFPGKHPPLAGAAPAPAPAPKAAAPRPAAPRKPTLRPAPAPVPAASKKTPVLIGVAAVVAAVAVAAVTWNSSRKIDPPPLTKKPEVVRAPDPAPPPPPPPKEEPKPEPPPPPPPPPPPKEDDGRKAYEERLAERKKESKARVEEALKEVAAQRKEAEATAKAAALRLAGKTVTVTLASGAVYKDAALKSWSINGADLDSGGRTVRIDWDAVQPASLLAAADLLFDAQRPQDQFDRGRFFVARRMWKEAQAAFSAAAKLGQGFESRVLEFGEILNRLANGQAGCRGKSRRIGRDIVRLSWDFRDARQLEDFTPGLALAERGVTLEAAKKTGIYLFGSAPGGDAPLAFVGGFSAELKLACDGIVTFHLFAGAGGGYELDLGPAGAALYRIDPKAAEKDRRRPVARSEKAKLVAGKSADVRLYAVPPRFRVMVDGAEALAAEDGPLSLTAEPPRGAFGWSLEKGKLRIEAPFAVQGRSDATELDRRIGDTEVMLRRALDPDLEQIERARELRKAMSALDESKDLALSSDDPYFAFRIGKFEDISKYEELKKTVGRAPDTAAADRWKAEVTALIAKYPEVPSLYYIRALFSFDRLDSFGTLADLRKAIELFPGFHEALALRSRTLLDKQEPAPALEAIRSALEAKPDYVDGLVILARCLYATAPDADGFMDALDLARKLDSEHSEAAALQRMLKFQRQGPRELGCRFDYETAHYRITTDISAEAAKEYGENLEAAFGHYSSSFKGGPARPLRSKPRVAIFNTAENYYTYFELLSDDRGENTLGAFRQAVNELVLYESTNIADTHQTLYHEAVHHYISLLTPYRLPYWFNEGIADYMGGIQVKDGKVVAKSLIQRNELPYTKLAVDANAALPFERIMNMTPREFYSGNTGLNYAQAWSMVHFFYEYDKGKYRGLIEEYLELLRQGRSTRACFDAVFRAKAAALEPEWRAYIKGL